nr:efflux RND transporter periplasmic adaptor subunit [Pseudenhygromyxa sp. WMMC2535]
MRYWRSDDAGVGGAEAGAVAVELAAVEHGPIARRRGFTASVEASAAFTLAPRVAGRVAAIDVDIGDPVRRGQVVATLDDAELGQAEAGARADMTVANARSSAAAKALEIAERDRDRARKLHARSIVSAQDLDEAEADALAAAADLEVARAEAIRAKATHAAAKIRRGEAAITADWEAGDDERVVAVRYADEGDALAVNAALFEIVELDPVIIGLSVTEADYVALREGMAVTIVADAFPGESFPGEIARIAPVFRAESRQARVEVEVPNPDRRLKPGMFVRAEVVLSRIEDATIVPAAAVVEREGEHVVFEVRETGEGERRVRQRAVTLGVEEGERVAVATADGEPLVGPVVVLGQQQLADGASVVVPAGVGGGPTVDAGQGAP